MDSERSMAKRLGQMVAVFFTGIVLVGCSDEQAAAPGAPPPAAVKVVTVKPEELPITNELPGRIAPTRLAEVRPRVSGIIVERVPAALGQTT